MNERELGLTLTSRKPLDSGNLLSHCVAAAEKSRLENCNMKAPPDSMIVSGSISSGTESECRNTLIFVSWVVILLAFDLLTLRSFPVPWSDETLFADPAASVVLNKHWTSTIWNGRGDFIFWGGNVPAYSALLVPWLWLWGVSAAAVRSLNCILVALTMICTWFSVKRLQLVPRPEIRLATLIALSLCYPVSYCVRCGRPDVLGMLIFSAGALFWADSRITNARRGLFFCAALIPFAGLQYAFYLPVLLGVLFWAGGRSALNRIVAIISGGLFGSALLFIYYQCFAGWDGLLASMADVHGRRPHGLWNSFADLMTHQIFLYYFGRPHFVLLIAAVVWLTASWRHLTGAGRRSLMLASIMLLVPGVIVGFFSHFMAPYHWLAVAPAMILLSSVICGSWKNFGPATKVFCALLILGLALSGRIVFVSLGLGLGSASYTTQIEIAAIGLIQPGENVFVDPQLYYAVKPRAGQIYYAEIVPRLTKSEKESVSVAFLCSADPAFGEKWFMNAFGGHWTLVADLPIPCAQVDHQPAASRLLSWFHAGNFVGRPLSVYRRDR